MKAYQWMLVAGVSLAMAGCAVSPEPQKTPMEIQSMQTRTFDTPKEVAFPSVVSVFQDLGYSIQTADIASGLISADSASENSPWLTAFTGQSQVRQTRATAFVEEIRDDTSVRLNFVESQETSSAYGRSDRNDTPIHDAELYQNAFERIENAIFVREGR